jgi:outer membrane receptor protein involved in Fe transport
LATDRASGRYVPTVVHQLPPFRWLAWPVESCFRWCGVEAYNLFDLNARFETGEKTEFRMGMINAFNKKPPQVGDTEANYDAQNYDVIGRYFCMGLTKKF